jgi:hypothetical protein
MSNYYHYHQKDLTEGGIIAAIQSHRQRGHKPEAAIVRPDSGIGDGTVEGLPVSVSDKIKPAKHFAVVI